VKVLVDTHILLWWFENPKRLSAGQKRLLDRAGEGQEVGVSDVTLWEIALLLERGRIRLALPLDEWLARATASPRVSRVGISPAIAREMVALSVTREWDPADRILVASARVFGVPLITADSRIIEAQLVRTV
jgi:PIN domain nuclease of toxin-antitoxin system